MRTRRRHAGTIKRGLIALVAFACTLRETGVGPSEGVATVSVSPPSATISVAASLQMSATAWDTAGSPLTGSSFTWTTSASGVASVNASGAVVGIGAGSATITATSGGKSGTATLTVTSVAVASVTVAPSAPSVLVGTTVPLAATLKDAAGNTLTGRPVTWRSSDSTRARVSTTGLVTGLVIGSATITATSEGRSGTASVTVTQIPVATLELTPATATILIAGTRQLTATPRDASGNPLVRPVTWTSSDTTKARVSGTGLVTGVRAGTASITASCEGQTAISLINVDVAPVASVQVTPASPSVLVGSTVQLTATTRDANGTVLTGRVVTWATSNDLRAQVSSAGVVLGVSAGTATITATSEGQNGSVTVTVNAVPVATVTVTPATSTIAANQTVQLTATMKDASGDVLAGRSVTWTSSHPTTRARVDANGLVTAVGTGTATITATSEGKSGTATVTVTATPVASVTITPATATIAAAATQQLTATTRDASGNVLTGRLVTWSTSNSLVAQVSTSGLVLGVAAGSATITATSEGQNGTASVTVTATAGQTLLSETFDDASLAARGWYDMGSPVITTAEKHSGAASLEMRWNAGQTNTISGAMRKLFAETDRIYVSYWVKYSTNYVGSGQPYHPHEFNILSNRDGDWDGPSLSWLNVYIEQGYQNGGIPRLAVQDSRMVDITNILVNLTGVTENRSVAGCNGNTDGTGQTACYQVSATEWYNAKVWDAAAVAFQPNPGVDYKGDWNHVEVYYQLNTIVGGIGQTNGIAQYWLNGNLKLQLTNVLFRTGANPTIKFRQLFFGPYIGDGSPVAQTMWIDDLTVGTARP